MLEDGKLTATEAADLLRALQGRQQTAPAGAGFGGAARFLRVRVTDLTSGTAKVNVTVPVGLVGVGLRMAERFAPDSEGLDREKLERLIASGATGKVVEVVDDADGERVEVYVE
jgi:hypothetical protein